MNQQEIKDLEKELWDAADDLRGNSKLTAAEYKDPLLGLVLLRFAQNRYEDAKIEVEKIYRSIQEPRKSELLPKMIIQQQVRSNSLKKQSMITWLNCQKMKILQRQSIMQ